MRDVIIIGAGVIGSSIARALSKYNLNVLVLEKNSDVGDETSSANSAIVHSGYDPHTGTLKAEMNVLGNKLFTEVCEDLDVEFERIGSLTIATNTEEVETLDGLYQNALANGVDVELLDQDKLFEIEPFVTKKAVKALYAPTAGIINPFELCVALMENAIDNGVELHLDEEVTSVLKDGLIFKVETDKDFYFAKTVINCAGVNSDVINNMVSSKKEEIKPRKGEYYVLDHFATDDVKYVTHTLFSVPSSKGKGVLVSPTTHGNFLIGPSSEFTDDKEDKNCDKETLDYVLQQAKRLVDDVPLKYLIREFSGVRAYHESNDFVINSPVSGFINMLGIQSPGLASSPAIALKCIKMLSSVLELKENKDYNPKRRPLYRLNKKSIEEREALIKENPDFGVMICRCEKVSLGEIKDAIHRSCGARTIKGVKKRVRPGFGKCQGGFCEVLVGKILAEELGKEVNEINYANPGSYILLSRTKEEN